MTALFVIIFIDKWEHADRHSPALIGLGVGVLCLLIFGQNSFMLPALLLSTALLLLITNTGIGKKKGGKDNDEVKTADEKTEIVTSPEDIIADEKEGAEDMTPTPMTPLQMVIAIVISAVITFSPRATALCDLSRQQENAKVARTHRKVAPGYDNVDTYNLLPEGHRRQYVRRGHTKTSCRCYNGRKLQAVA